MIPRDQGGTRLPIRDKAMRGHVLRHRQLASGDDDDNEFERAGHSRQYADAPSAG